MTAWVAPWHLIPIDALRHWLHRRYLHTRAVLAGHCVVLAWRIQPAYALRLMKALALTEADTSVQPVVLKPQRQVIAGIRPFALKAGYHLRPQIDEQLGRDIARCLGNIAFEINYSREGWENRCAVETAKVALNLGADRFDAALFDIAKWDLPQEPAGDEDSPTQQTQVLDHPWPSNERLADGDY